MAVSYCENGSTVLKAWVDHGLAPCFIDTWSTILLCLITMPFCLIEIVMYQRHGSHVDHRMMTKSYLHYLQLTCHLCLAIILPLMWESIDLLQYGGQKVYGHAIVRNASQMLLWLLVLVTMYHERHYNLPSPPAHGHSIVLLLFWSMNLIIRLLPIVNFNSADYWWHRLHEPEARAFLIIYAADLILSLLAFILGLRAPGLPTAAQRHAFMYEHPGVSETDAQRSTWIKAARQIRQVLPYIWPSGYPILQMRVFACILLLVAGRLLNVYVPIYYKIIVNALGEQVFPLWPICIYCALRYLQGGGINSGMLTTIRGLLWIGVQQYTTREVQVGLIAHLHALSFRWHIGRKTGEVLRIVDRGTESINSLLSYVLFNIVPTIVDIIIAIAYFTVTFNIWFGLITFATMFIYLIVTIFLTEWRTKFRRDMNLKDNAARAIAVDSLLNFETVKYYNGEDYEVARYRQSILDYQRTEWKSQASMFLLNSAQGAVIGGGLLGGSLLCAQLVASGEMTVGDYVLFATYIMQLYTPLNFLGTYYRLIQKSFIDMENMFDVLAEKQEIVDADQPINVQSNESSTVEFRNVSFTYANNKPDIIKNLSFIAPAGLTIAFVGPSGAGKSTILRLLFRFFDVRDGKILIDGVDVRHMRQRQLRQLIGVVPQDTVLFNETIEYNIAYGRAGEMANKYANINEIQLHSDVIDAAKAAGIHDAITNFPEAYETIVGERGLKLSGGEKQRVAIARTILKAPKIVMLDEATSALDTARERQIQASLAQVCSGRTTIIVAHRLSTVVNANCIYVLNEGEIVESGTHDKLLLAKGVYSNMWNEQQSKDDLNADSVGYSVVD